MSQPLPQFHSFDPGSESHPDAPFINLPVNSLSDKSDPTQEIRTLITDLQNAARDSRAKLIAAERARDVHSAQLEQANQKIEQFRTQFVEISTVLRERDSATETANRLALQVRELEKQQAVTLRERTDAQRKADDATRQRDEAVQRREDTTRNANGFAAQLAEVQRQVLSIRQARDSAQAQNQQLIARVAQFEDELGEIASTRESMQKASKNAAEEITTLRKQLEAAKGDLDRGASQLGEVQRELDEQRSKVLDLTEEKFAVALADSEHSAALAEARQQVISFTQERDAARQRHQEQALELDEVRSQLLELREHREENTVPAADLEELKRQLASVIADREVHLQREAEFLGETVSQQDRLAAITEQLSAAQRGREEALTSLTAAQKQIERIVSERDSVRQRSIESSLDLDDQMAGIQRIADEAEERISEAHRARDEALFKAEQFDKQRLASIEIAAQLDTARRDILSLSADLAEARLRVKFAESSGGAYASPVRLGPRTLDLDLGDPVASDVPKPGEAPPIAAAVNEQFTDKNGRETLNAIQHCLQAFVRHPQDIHLVGEIQEHSRWFAERARVSNFVALHRIGAALTALAQHLSENPEGINSSTLRTLTQTVDFLAILLRQRDYSQLKNPSKATVYAIDDDRDNCNAIQLALESAGLRTHCTQEPAVALAELAGSRFDLVLLDIGIPGMDGFELCQSIRQLAIHARTPIVFITGLDSVENRVQSSLSGGSDFLGKPFNCAELTLKALVLIMQASLKVE